MRAVGWTILAAGLLPGLAAAQTTGPRIYAGQGLAGVFSEIRGGAIWHDPGAKEDSFAVNGEVLFATPVPERLTAGLPPLYRWVFEPRPHLGFHANTDGKTSKGYAGLTWTTFLARDVLRRGDGIRFDFLFGGSLNDGKHNARLADRKDLGGNLLFHVGAEIGYQVDRNWSVSFFVDHDSNGGTARRNQGLNSLGLRLGYAL
ncbi:acyloxyacyl hydrolase [Paracraurococcus ruber]|uniref:acyloxyacyl hydrolase n=1 Tax=Paracraurococcus ruber TaxID=77675 RepID=UPI0013052945|nr:acyloxyacyl hydrolase [Paracraurococcus ruber]